MPCEHDLLTMESGLRMAASLLLILLSAAHLITGFEIQVINRTNDSVVLNLYSDYYAAIDGRSSSISGPIEGLLVYLTPRNACSPLEPAPLPAPNVTLIAFVPSFTDCPYDNVDNIDNAKYSVMVAAVSRKWERDHRLVTGSISQALISESFGTYLQNNAVISNYSSNSTYDIYIRISNDSFDIRTVLVFFALVLFGAIAVSICVFCTVAACRWVIYKWRTRGLTRWRVRQLPKRRYRLRKEGVQTCSICLDEYKDREYVRVLPCDHLFHPKCVDEWLRKWNRTCPLCKTSISHTRRNRRAEASLLLENDRSSGGGGRDSYGSTVGTDEQGQQPIVATAIVHDVGSTSPMAAAV